MTLEQQCLMKEENITEEVDELSEEEQQEVKRVFYCNQ